MVQFDFVFTRYRIVFFVAFVVGSGYFFKCQGGAAFLGEDWVYLVGSVRIRFK